MRTDLSEVIAENFGANATYVEGLLSRFRSNPELVDESWRAYFTELLGNGERASAPPTAIVASTERQQDSRSGDNGQTASAADTQTGTAKATAKTAGPAASATPAQETKPSSPAPVEKIEAKPIRGAALKIVENMEASLSVPTATSQRRIPVKLLDENRQVINRYLAENHRGKASYTHVIAWALLRALDEFPQLNDGYETVDGVPSRMIRPDVNLGVAIDLEKKDGTRSLLVPNIKGRKQAQLLSVSGSV